MTPEEIEKRTDELARRSAKPNNLEVKGKLDHWVAAWPKLRSKRSNGENVYLHSNTGDLRKMMIAGTTMTIR
jgi:hypothetical protein